jgi:hypothetical protein
MAKYTDNANGGAEIELDATDPRTKFLIEEGYVGKPKVTEKDDERGKYATSVAAKDDPRLAINREDPTPVNKQRGHIANADIGPEGGETILGKDRGLDAKVTDTAPKVKVTAHAKAGELPEVDRKEPENSSLKEGIDKEQGQPDEPKLGKVEKTDPGNSLKEAIDKKQPDVTTPVPASGIHA